MSQDDLTKLVKWSEKWQMNLNKTFKCRHRTRTKKIEYGDIITN